MRALLPEPAEDVDLHRFYATDWIEVGGLRANFVAAADGAAQAGGKSKGLQTKGDNAVFSALRDLADVVLVGSGTVTIEGYQAVRVSDRRRGVRREYGLADTLPVAVMSRSLQLNPDSELFTEAGARTVVLTCEAAPAERRAALSAVADVTVCGEREVEPLLARGALEERGLTRILSEGGPTVYADLARAEVVDELCLSLTPLLVGPGPTRITAGEQLWPVPQRLRLAGLLEEDGALFLRYRAG